jgi:hypothetical protein
MVEPEVLSTDNVVGEAEIVDTLADTAPTVKVTLTVLINVIPSVVLVAETFLISAFVDLSMAVVCPLASVAEAGWVIVTPVAGVADIVALLPDTGLPNRSFMVIVIVEPETSSTDNVDGEAEIVDTLADTTSGLTVTVG